MDPILVARTLKFLEFLDAILMILHSRPTTYLFYWGIGGKIYDGLDWFISNVCPGIILPSLLHADS